MNEGIKKFRELLLTDEAFQQKVKAATEAYTGEPTEEAVFNNVLLPLAQEYGISATFEDFKAYNEGFGDQEMDADDLAQVAGGTKGFLGDFCVGIGIGAGLNLRDDEEDDVAMCYAVGFGYGAQTCLGKGVEVG